jgi:hypothetical protein
MYCVGCGWAAATERPVLTAQGYRRFRCRDCGKQSNVRSSGVLNRASLPSDIIAFVVFCRLRYRLTLRLLPAPECSTEELCTLTSHDLLQRTLVSPL